MGPSAAFAGEHSTTEAFYQAADGHEKAAHGNEAFPDSPVKSGAARTAVPDHHAKAQVPRWDELAHIHHFHKHRMKKMKRHYKKCVLLSKILLLVCHAAVLLISYLHIVSH